MINVPAVAELQKLFKESAVHFRYNGLVLRFLALLEELKMNLVFNEETQIVPSYYGIEFDSLEDGNGVRAEANRINLDLDYEVARFMQKYRMLNWDALASFLDEDKIMGRVKIVNAAKYAERTKTFHWAEGVVKEARDVLNRVYSKELALEKLQALMSSMRAKLVFHPDTGELAAITFDSVEEGAAFWGIATRERFYPESNLKDFAANNSINLLEFASA